MRRDLTLVFAVGALMLAGCAGGSSSLIPGATGDPGLRGTQSVDSAATKLKCFSGTTDGGYGGTCTLTSTGAVLSTVGTNPNGDYAGVYISSTNNMKTRPLSQVDTMSFDLSGDPPIAGGPRFSVAYTTDNGATTREAYVSAFYCDTAGHVDIHNAACEIFTSAGGDYPTWAAFVAANPTGRLNGIPFVIADRASFEAVGFTWTVTNVSISK